MAYKFKKGDIVYFKVAVHEVAPCVAYDYTISWVDPYSGNETTDSVSEEQLYTAEEVAGTLKTKADAMTVTADSLQEENEELKDKCAEFLKTIGKQSEQLRELQARIVELNEVNSSLGENRDALNNEAAVHMTSIHNLQVAVEVLAEKIFEMRCEQDG